MTKADPPTRPGSAFDQLVLTKIDPLGWGEAVGAVWRRALGRPLQLAGAVAQAATAMARIPAAATAVWSGDEVTPPVPTDPKDRRFSDPAWSQNPYFFAMRQCYLAACQLADGVLAAGTGGDIADVKAAQITHLVANALAPTNFHATNPAVLSRMLTTGGHSAVEGAVLFVDDLRHRGGRPVKVDSGAFQVGRNLAATPGKVVYRNDLVELIQYEAQTDTVYEIPVLASPPWINKYYVMDLAPGRSFLEWAVQHGRTVFCLSYKNPDESMRELSMDDYLQSGVRAELDVVAEITGSDRVDIAGLCLGGAMTAILAAHLAAGGESRLGSLTLINTMLDYGSPGELATMVDGATLARVGARMAKTGFLPGKDMSAAFDLLRPNDLIFNYVVSRWLQGLPPSAFDILAWNEDATRMPAAMHAEYLDALYLRNALARGEMTMAGRELDLGAVTNDAYVIGAVNDHIVPWTSSYQAVNLLGGRTRYVLSSGGHVAGIVNPPSPKSWHEALPLSGNDPYPRDPAAWRASAERVAGSWWEDWTAWSSPRAGAQRKPPRVGSRKHPVLGDAPGTYVLT